MEVQGRGEAVKIPCEECGLDSGVDVKTDEVVADVVARCSACDPQPGQTVFWWEDQGDAENGPKPPKLRSAEVIAVGHDRVVIDDGNGNDHVVMRSWLVNEEDVDG